MPVMQTDIDDTLDADDEKLVADEASEIFADERMRRYARHYMAAGLAIADLAHLFHTKRQAITAAVADLQPTGRRGKVMLYSVAEVAAQVIKPALDIESHIRGLKPKDLPASLQKAFWDAQEARQSYEERAGNLWHTHRVQAVVGQLVMLVRQRMVLASDQLDRLAPLNDEQRRLAQALFDQVLTELQRTVLEAFKDYKGTGDRQDLYEHGAAHGDGLDL